MSMTHIRTISTLLLVALLLLALLLAAIPAVSTAAEDAGIPPSGPFQTVHCLKYAGLTAPLSGLVVGVKPDPTMEHPMVICVARRPGQTVVLDSGFVDENYGRTQGVSDFTRLAERLGDIGVNPDDVDLVTLGHLHWDHAGGTSVFQNARFVLQRRELEFAAIDVPGNPFIRAGFRPEEVADALRLKWDGRLDLVDGDAENWQDSMDLYLTPGHTGGTMTVCLATVKGRVCYTSDAVYSYENLEQNLPLGIAVLPTEMFDSFAKIRRILRGGKLIPGHAAAAFGQAETRGFRRVSDRVLAVVE